MFTPRYCFFASKVNINPYGESLKKPGHNLENLL